MKMTQPCCEHFVMLIVQVQQRIQCSAIPQCHEGDESDLSIWTFKTKREEFILIFSTQANHISALRKKRRNCHPESCVYVCVCVGVNAILQDPMGISQVHWRLEMALIVQKKHAENPKLYM